MGKVCRECKKLLDEAKFYPSSLRYFDYICIRCHRKKGKLYRSTHKEKIAEQKKEYAEANREKINEWHKEWARNNKDKRKIVCHRWYIKKKRECPEYFPEARARYVDKKVIYIRNYRRRYPEKAASWKHNRRALEKALGGHFIAEQWKILKRSFNNACPKCQRKEPEIKLTVDHIIPSTKWKRWERENLPDYKWNDIENIQPLCKNCNSKKSAKI